MLQLLAATSVALTLLAAPTAAAAASAAPAPDSVTVAVQTVNGSGCKAGSAHVRTASDKSSFAVYYDDYEAVTGGWSNSTDFRKNCQLNVLVGVPQGFTYAIAEIEYKGRAYLRPGATAQQNAVYYFAGTTPTAETNFTLHGPYDGGWKNTDTAEALVWAPCATTTNLNINSDLRVRANGSADKVVNSISMNRSRADVETIFHFSWKRC